MTAEVAILNKSAVVLAADSAVTISRGNSQDKTFDSADKLFELSCNDPIGIMVYGGLDFMEAPLSILIKDFRNSCLKGSSVQDVAQNFLEYLSSFGSGSNDEVTRRSIVQSVGRVLTFVQDRVSKQFTKKLSDPDFIKENGVGDDFASGLLQVRDNLYREQIKVVTKWLSYLPDAQFIGKGGIRIGASHKKLIREEAERIMPALSSDQMDEVMKLGVLSLKKVEISSSKTGIIIAGFGKDELFPTLLSYSLYGVVSGRLKYKLDDKVDIDRSGARARVVAFAQREMVERFIYGIDNEVERNVKTFAKEGVAAIRNAIFNHLEVEENSLDSLRRSAEEAEEAFLDGLATSGFQAIRRESEAELEGMVEFMPKIEMARMAEALVNLTSIKRRVSRGMETVGGPIDVAVISKSEGLVWVKRKHYFPAELNSRFFQRTQMLIDKKGPEDGLHV